MPGKSRSSAFKLWIEHRIAEAVLNNPENDEPQIIPSGTIPIIEGDVLLLRANANCRVCARLAPDWQTPASRVKRPFPSVKTAAEKRRTAAETLSQARSPSAANSLQASEGVPFRFFSRGVFSSSWYFRENPKNGVGGRFAGAFRPHATLYSRLPVARIWGLYGLAMYLNFNSRHPQYSHSNHVSAA